MVSLLPKVQENSLTNWDSRISAAGLRAPTRGAPTFLLEMGYRFAGGSNGSEHQKGTEQRGLPS